VPCHQPCGEPAGGEAILQRAESELDEYEREQLELMREQEKASKKWLKKQGW